MLEGAGRRKTYAMDVLVGAFFVWVAVSGVLALDPGLAWRNWATPTSWVMMYYLVTRIVVSPRRLLLFWLAFFLVHLKMSQAGTRNFVARGFTFTDYGVMGGPGWFSNSGELAMEMAAIVGMTLCFLLALRGRMSKRRLYFLIALLTGTALITNIASSSRGGQLALAVELTLLYLLLAKVRLRNVLIGAAVLVIGWMLVPAEQKERFQTIGEDETSELRLVAWEHAWDVTLERPLTGLGFENWRQYYFSIGGSGHLVHNTVLQATSELGFPGLLLFLGAVGASFVLNARTRRRAKRHGEWAGVYRGMALGLDMGMVALFIAAQFMSVLFYPSFWMGFALTISLAETVRRAEADGALGRRVAHSPGARPAALSRRPTAAVHRAVLPPSTVRPHTP
jgi:putative inorganic carbon (hco3(-)) transporter